jgi:hypothetical protein
MDLGAARFRSGRGSENLRPAGHTPPAHLYRAVPTELSFENK